MGWFVKAISFKKGMKTGLHTIVFTITDRRIACRCATPAGIYIVYNRTGKNIQNSPAIVKDFPYGSSGGAGKTSEKKLHLPAKFSILR